MRDTPQDAIDLIKVFEGFSPTIYLCPAGVPTIGYGHVVRKGEFRSNARITTEQGEVLLQKDVQWAERSVLRLVSIPLTDGQYGALVSFTFNLGSGRLQSSTLRMKLNRGDCEGAANEFWKWRRAGGRILPGLVRRRAAETTLFRS